MKRFYWPLRRFQPQTVWVLLCILTFSLLFLQVKEPFVFASFLSNNKPATAIPKKLQLDTHLPVVTYDAQHSISNVNAKFGSRFDFVISRGMNAVQSGTDGLFHDNSASYIVGIAPSGKHITSIFHMGIANVLQGDTYLLHQRWTLGLNTSRWEGDTSDNSGLHVTVDFIDTFLGEPGCTFVANCSESVRDDTVPVLLVGVSLQNTSSKTLSGDFLFGSNRSLPAANACMLHTTPGGTAVDVLSYDTSSDKTNTHALHGGTTVSVALQYRYE